MKALLVFLIGAWGLAACDSPHPVKSDVNNANNAINCATPDIPEDPDLFDIIDVTDDIDAQDVPDATGIPTDPDEHLIVCDRKLAALHYPWMYYNLLKIIQVDGYYYPFDQQYRFNLETGIEEQLPDRDKSGYGVFSYINPNTQKRYTPGRSIRWRTSPSVDGEYGPWKLTVTDVQTGISQEWDPGVELLSEDCLNYDLYDPNGKAVMSVWKMSDDEREAVFSCEGSNMDVYKVDLLTGERTYFLRGMEEPVVFAKGTTGYSFQDPGGDFIVMAFRWMNFDPMELRVWNWRTGERVFTFSHPELTGGSPAAEDGWLYYTLREQRGNDWYLKIEGYNFLTGQTGSPPMVMDNTLAPMPAIAGHPEYVFYMAGDGPISSAEPRLPTGETHYYLWNRETDVVRRVTRIPNRYGSGVLALGQDPPQTAVYLSVGGTYPCYYAKNLIDAGIMDPLGNLLPEP